MIVLIRGLLKWFSSELTEIDVESGALSRPGPPGTKALVVVVVSTLMLGLLSMGINDRDFRDLASNALFAWFGLGEGLSVNETIHRQGFMSNLTWALGCVFCYLLVPALVVKFAFKERLADYGWTTSGFRRHLPIYGLLFLPVGLLVLVMSYDPGFQETYPFYFAPESLLALLIWEVAYGLQFLSLEFFFRGFMLHGLKHRYGHGAIWIMLIPYVMIHFTKPPLEAAGAVIAGVVLAVLSLRTRSILGGVAIHASVAWMMDLMSLWQRGVLQTLW